MNEEEANENNSNNKSSEKFNYLHNALDSSSQNTKLATSHNDSCNLTESVDFENINSELHNTIPSILANKTPRDNPSTSLLITQPNSSHQNQVIEYSCKQLFSRFATRIKKCVQKACDKLDASSIAICKFSLSYILRLI